jgi:hypothetical protein
MALRISTQESDEPRWAERASRDKRAIRWRMTAESANGCRFEIDRGSDGEEAFMIAVYGQSRRCAYALRPSISSEMMPGASFWRRRGPAGTGAVASVGHRITVDPH